MVFLFSCETCSNLLYISLTFFSCANLLKQSGLAFENNKFVSFDLYSLTSKDTLVLFWEKLLQKMFVDKLGSLNIIHLFWN